MAMLRIERFVFNMLQENCYVLWDESREATVVDCGAFSPQEHEQLRRYFVDNALRPVRLLQTHAHFDHLFGADFLHSTYGLRPAMHRDEVATYASATQQATLFMHRPIPLTLPPAGDAFDSDERIAVGSHGLHVLHTPGHTPGGVCFYEPREGVLLSGDSLFRGSIGRCDLPGGDEQALVAALRQRVLTLPDDVTVCPGHGPATTVGEERRSNPYLY